MIVAPNKKKEHAAALRLDHGLRGKVIRESHIRLDRDEHA
jgi:hypothetical protein